MLLTATIDAVSPATPRALHVRLRLDGPFSFAPGQAALVGAHGSGERRPYSIAVGPEEAARSGCLEFLIGLGPDGTPGPHLPRAEPGERVDVEGPLGAFTFPDAPAERNFLFVAGGSGIAPIRSCCITCWRSIVLAGVARIQRARAPEELAFDAEPAPRPKGLHYYATTTARGQVGRPDAHRPGTAGAVRHRPGDAVLRMRARVAGARGAAHAARARHRGRADPHRGMGDGGGKCEVLSAKCEIGLQTTDDRLPTSPFSIPTYFALRSLHFTVPSHCSRRRPSPLRL